MKRKQEEVEKMRALDEKHRRLPGAKAVHHNKVAVPEKERLVHVLSELLANAIYAQQIYSTTPLKGESAKHGILNSGITFN